MRLSLWLFTLGVPSLAITAHAQKDLAGCKTVFDANLKTLKTTHHGYSTQTRAGKTTTSESIIINGKSYFEYQGKWQVSPMTLDELIQLNQKNIDSAKVYTCKATGPSVYHVHTENAIAKYDGDVWVANGLVTRVEQDVDMGDPNRKMHVSTKYDYSNVTTPPGV